MDLDEFIRERRPRWTELERLLERVENMPEGEIGSKTIQNLVRLYRQACSDLNYARSVTANPQLLERLNQLTGRGYRYVYRNTRRESLWRGFLRLFLVEVPSTFRKEARTVAFAAGGMIMGSLFGFAVVMMNPHHARDLVPELFFSESPSERVKRIEQEGERIDTVDKAAEFGTMLFTHNIQVSFLAFALGAVTVLLGVYYLFWTGTFVGAIAAQYYLDDVGTFFIAWVGPHGALELPAIVFAGAAGLVAGRALFLPGNQSVVASLRKVFPTVWRMILGTAAILVCAGLIEGSFSQFSAKTMPYAIKIGVAIVLFLLLFVYLFLRRIPETEEFR